MIKALYNEQPMIFFFGPTILPSCNAAFTYMKYVRLSWESGSWLSESYRTMFPRESHESHKTVARQNIFVQQSCYICSTVLRQSYDYYTTIVCLTYESTTSMTYIGKDWRGPGLRKDNRWTHRKLLQIVQNVYAYIVAYRNRIEYLGALQDRLLCAWRENSR